MAHLIFGIVPAFLFVVFCTDFSLAVDSYSIFKSTDGGQSWSRFDTGMPGHSRINAFGAVDGVLFAGTDAGVFLSTNKGRSWQPPHPPTDSVQPTLRVLSFATLDGKVFAGTDSQGVVVSSDKGQTWVLVATLPRRKVLCLLVHGGYLYAGTDADGVFASRDGGQTWTRRAAGFPTGAQVFVLTASDGALFAGLYSKGLWVWDERRQSWSGVGNVTPLALATVGRNLVAGHNPGGLRISHDLGVTWTKGKSVGTSGSHFAFPAAEDDTELPAEGPVWKIASNDTKVFAGVGSGIFYSDDLGRNWTRARRGLPAESPGIAFLVSNEFILAATPARESNGSGQNQKPKRVEASGP